MEEPEATGKRIKEENETTSSEPGAGAAAEESVKDNRKQWDFTSRKVMVKNTLKMVDKKNMQKMIDSWMDGLGTRVKVCKVKKPPKDNWVVLTLEAEDQVPIFIDHVNKNNFTNKKGDLIHAVKVVEEEEDQKQEYSLSNKRMNDSQPTLTKRQKSQREADAFTPRVVTDEEIKDKMIPLWRKTYPEQVIAKAREMVKKCAIKVVKEIKQKFQQLDKEARRNKDYKKVIPYAWLNIKRAIEVAPIIKAESIVRNKCEFTFGYRYIDGNDEAEKMVKIPSVGSMANGWSGGVSNPRCCRNMPSEATAIVDIVEKFLADCPMPPYDPKVHQGFWRTLMVRSSRRTRECMIVIVHAPISGGVGSKSSDVIDNYTAEVFESEKSRLLGMLTGKDLPVISAKVDHDNGQESQPESFLQVTSIFFQEYGDISFPPPEHPLQHVYGAKTLQEKLGQCTFQISPKAFFQVNTEMAEVLYNVVAEKVREVTDKPEETLCFDVCCGTGTIGLTLMKQGVVGRVVGIDISAPAIEDAKINAQLNGFGGSEDDEDAKTRFVAERAEHAMQAELSRVRKTTGKIVAVVDPARDGLHANVLKSIRGFSHIHRLVYVSCNPTGSLVVDAATLCLPPSKRLRGMPFKPTFCQPVDMFPYSDHCEMVMVFDRMTEEDVGQENIKEQLAKSEDMAEHKTE